MVLQFRFFFLKINVDHPVLIRISIWSKIYFDLHLSTDKFLFSAIELDFVTINLHSFFIFFTDPIKTNNNFNIFILSLIFLK